KQPRKATFVCALGYMRSANDQLPSVAVGQWHGAITREKHGDSGFGYDPVFWDFEHKMTSAQMSKDLKTKLSHRGKACRKLLQKLKKVIV
ncbi:MAG: non-canonical purine NTP pyrophosphatase, partial [Proteobacteria bacterium]|nr:non-canonical purine NTP pyrophosphatase [Pseudomonadota bacterium]